MLYENRIKLPRQKSSDIYSTGPPERMGTCGLMEVVRIIFRIEILFQLVGLNRSRHMSFLTGQDRTPKFA